jgi:N-methylhydantoinase B
VLRLVRKYGKDTIVSAFAEVQDYVERFTRARIAALPDGVWECEDYVDFDPNGSGDGLIPIHVKMTIQGDQVHYDLAGSHAAIGSLANAAFGGAFSGIVSGMKLFFPEVPLNSGFYRPVTFHLPEGSVVNTPAPFAVSGFVFPYDKILNSVVTMWSEIMPERAMAGAFNIEYLHAGGFDRRPNVNRFCMWYDFSGGGWGGRNGKDGPSATSALFGPGLLNQPIEGQERIAPALYERNEMLEDSGGPGRWRGGVGLVKSLEFWNADGIHFSYLCDRERTAPWGIEGGLPSIPMGLTVYRGGRASGGDEIFLGAFFSDFPLEQGDLFYRTTAGGGGFGDPLARDPEAVREDVVDGYVTVERAVKDYGVVVRELDVRLCRYEVDLNATERARAELRIVRLSRLSEDPHEIAARYRAGELDALDLLRHYGVIVDWGSGGLRERTTEQFRAELRRRAADWWADTDALAAAGARELR